MSQRPFDSSITYSLSSEDITWSPPGGATDELHTNISDLRSSLDPYYDSTTFSGDSESFFFNQAYNIYARTRSDSSHSVIHYNPDKNRWDRTVFRDQAKSAGSTAICVGTIGENYPSSIREKNLVQLYGYKDSDGGALDYRYFDSEVSEFGRYVVYEKGDKKFFLFGINSNPKNLDYPGLESDYTDVLDIDSSLRPRDSFGNLTTLVPLSDIPRQGLAGDSAYVARIVRLRPVGQARLSQGDSTEYFKFGFEIPIVVDQADVDSYGAFWNDLHEGMSDYVLDPISFDHFNFTGRSNAKSEYTVKVTQYVDSALSNANIPTGAELGTLALALTNGISEDSDRILNKASGVIDQSGTIWQKYYKYSNKFMTTDIISRYGLLDSGDSLVSSWLADPDNLREGILIGRDYLIRIDSA